MSVIVRKKVHVNMCLILNSYQERDVLISSPNLVRFFFLWGWMKGEVYKRKLDTQDLLPFWMLLPAKRNLKINSEEKHSIFAHVLQSEMKVTLGFSNIYCKM